MLFYRNSNMELTSAEKETIRLNIGGRSFKCYSNTLQTYPESKLARLSTELNDYCSEQNEYFFDRNPILFTYIIDAYRKGAVHLPKNVCGTTFQQELEFWNISPRYVAPCCYEALYSTESDIKNMELMIQKEKENIVEETGENPGLRKNLWRFLHDPNSSKVALVWSLCMSFLVVAAVFTDALSTVSAFQQNFTETEMRAFRKLSGMFNGDNTTIDLISTKKPIDITLYVMTICHSLLTLEFVLYFIACENRRAYFICFTRVLTFLGYLSFWIVFVIYINLEHLVSAYAMNAYFIFSYVQLFKLARLLYFLERTHAYNVMCFTCKASIEDFKILIILLGMLVTIFGYIMYAAEWFKNPKMSNIFSAIYWALITITTVGYGDYTPQTTAGHVISCACAVVGILVLAIPVGIIASNFYKFYHFHGYVRQHVQNIQHDLCTKTNKTAHESDRF